MPRKPTTQERLRIILRAEGVPENREPSGLAKLAGPEFERQHAWNWLNGPPDMVIDAKAAFGIEDRTKDHFRAEWVLFGDEPRTLAKPPSAEVQSTIDAVLDVPAGKLKLVRDLAIALKPALKP